MITDPKLMEAVSRILQRAEKHIEINKLVSTFVDVGLSTQIQNNNNQIIYGRRGTGKTHILSVVADNLRKDGKKIICYIDMRTLGSSSQYLDTQTPIKERCRLLFSDFIREIANTLLEYITSNTTDQTEKVFLLLNELSMLPSRAREDKRKEDIVEKVNKQTQSEASLGIGINPATGIGFNANAGRQTEDCSEVQRTYTKEKENGIVFPDLKRKLEEILNSLSSVLYIFVDEWSSLPIDVQPFFSELLKRGFLPIPRVVVKIAALEYRSKFNSEIEGVKYGFEIGADIATTLDIDEYYVYDRNPAIISDVFSQILYRHLTSELEEGYLLRKYSIRNSSELVLKMFASRDVFDEMVRAAEGVIRDLINIFTAAFFDSGRRARHTIDRISVLEAARQWFEKDKSNNLSTELQAVLRRIVDTVIGKRKARSFLVQRELERNPKIQQLFDYRIIHLIKRGYADKENPGLRYNIYTLDYGTYVDLIKTLKQPQLDMVIIDKETRDTVVPFDDKRSIRRIILSESDLGD